MRTSRAETRPEAITSALTTVPEIRELSVGAATRALKAAGLNWKIVNGPRGWVYRLSPNEGKLVRRGTIVTLYLRTRPVP